MDYWTSEAGSSPESEESLLVVRGVARREEGWVVTRVFNSGMKKKSAITDIGEISGISGFFIFIFIFIFYFLCLLFKFIF